MILDEELLPKNYTYKVHFLVLFPIASHVPWVAKPVCHLSLNDLLKAKPFTKYTNGINCPECKTRLKEMEIANANENKGTC